MEGIHTELSITDVYVGRRIGNESKDFGVERSVPACNIFYERNLILNVLRRQSENDFFFPKYERNPQSKYIKKMKSGGRDWKRINKIGKC
jgi:hypothetical protein